MIARNRKAIAAAVTALLGTGFVAVLDDGLTGAELLGLAAAAVVAFVGVWATPANEPPAPGQLGEGRHAS